MSAWRGYARQREIDAVTVRSAQAPSFRQPIVIVRDPEPDEVNAERSDHPVEQRMNPPSPMALESQEAEPFAEPTATVVETEATAAQPAAAARMQGASSSSSTWQAPASVAIEEESQIAQESQHLPPLVQFGAGAQSDGREQRAAESSDPNHDHDAPPMPKRRPKRPRTAE